jgi:hypothetical protein
MRTLEEHATRSGFSLVRQAFVGGRATPRRWVVDDRGRVAALNSHPVALWASAFDQPIKAILDLGFICIEERSKNLILALTPSRVRRATLVGTFYFLAHQDANRFVIYSDCGTESAHYTIFNDVNIAYELLEEMVTTAPADIPSITNRLERKTEKRSIRYARSRSPPARLCRLRMVEAEQPLGA